MEVDRELEKMQVGGDVKIHERLVRNKYRVQLTLRPYG